MKLMGRHPELYNLSLGTRDNIVGQKKHCLSCMIANICLGARDMYNHALTKPTEAAGQSYHTDLLDPVRTLGIGQAKYVLAVVYEYTTIPACHSNAQKESSSLIACTAIRTRSCTSSSIVARWLTEAAHRKGW